MESGMLKDGPFRDLFIKTTLLYGCPESRAGFEEVDLPDDVPEDEGWRANYHYSESTDDVTLGGGACFIMEPAFERLRTHEKVAAPDKGLLDDRKITSCFCSTVRDTCGRDICGRPTRAEEAPPPHMTAPMSQLRPCEPIPEGEGNSHLGSAHSTDHDAVPAFEPPRVLRGTWGSPQSNLQLATLEM